MADNLSTTTTNNSSSVWIYPHDNNTYSGTISGGTITPYPLTTSVPAAPLPLAAFADSETIDISEELLSAAAAEKLDGKDGPRTAAVELKKRARELNRALRKAQVAGLRVELRQRQEHESSVALIPAVLRRL